MDNGINQLFQERDFVLAGTGHMNCYGKSKYLLTKSPVVVKDEKPSLFETYPAKPPTDYRLVSVAKYSHLGGVPISEQLGGAVVSLMPLMQPNWLQFSAADCVGYSLGWKCSLPGS